MAESKIRDFVEVYFEMFWSSKNKANGKISGEKVYMDMRSMALSVTPQKIGMDIKNDGEAYGYIMDMGVSKGAVATMVLFADGTASMYFSTGGGIIGAGQHEAVSKAVKGFFAGANNIISELSVAEATDIKPQEDHTLNYFLTTGGIRGVELVRQKYNEYPDALKFIYYASNLVLTEIRKASKETQAEKK